MSRLTRPYSIERLVAAVIIFAIVGAAVWLTR